jgi:hypothetical protein
MSKILTFRVKECSRFALSGKRMFPTLTFRVEESSRFSPSRLKNAQDSLTFRVEECSRFSLSAWKKECLDTILCFREEPGCSKV